MSPGLLSHGRGCLFPSQEAKRNKILRDIVKKNQSQLSEMLQHQEPATSKTQTKVLMINYFAWLWSLMYLCMYRYTDLEHKRATNKTITNEIWMRYKYNWPCTLYIDRVYNYRTVLYVKYIVWRHFWSADIKAIVLLSSCNRDASPSFPSTSSSVSPSSISF